MNVREHKAKGKIVMNGQDLTCIEEPVNFSKALLVMIN